KQTAACKSPTGGRRKLPYEEIQRLREQGLSTPKLAKQLGVSQRPVCTSTKKLDLVAEGKPGPLPRYEKVGSKHFRCASCKRVELLQQRAGRICHKCRNKLRVSTLEGALHY